VVATANDDDIVHPQKVNKNNKFDEISSSDLIINDNNKPIKTKGYLQVIEP
jgi:hypothetical protein